MQQSTTMAASGGKNDKSDTVTTANAIYGKIGLTSLRLIEWTNKTSVSVTVPATVQGLPVTEIG